MENLSIPYSVEKIGDNAFSSCVNLKNVTYASKAEEVGKALFAHCPNLTEVKLTEGVPVIGEEAFWDCKKLESFIIPGTVKAIEAKAFDFCESIKTVIVPSSVTYIGKAAFADTKATVCIMNKKCKIYDSEDTIAGLVCGSKKSNANAYADKYGKNMKLSKVSSGNKCINVKWEAQEAEGHQVQYATNSKFKKAKKVKIADGETASAKITKLKSATKYYVRIRAYAGGMYTDWSDCVTVITK